MCQEATCFKTRPAISTRAAARSRVGALTALFITGFGTFLNLYATQPLLPRFREIFQASELMVSLTVSSTVLAVALMAPLVGLLADSVGRKRVIVAAMLGLAFPTALAGISTNLSELIAWRFLQGVFTPGIIAVAIAYISEESPGESVGSTMAIYVTGTVIGGFSGRFIVGLVEIHWGWRIAFFILGSITFAAALTTWWLLPRSTKFVRQSSAAAALRSMRAHLRNPQLLATCAVGFNVLFCMAGAFTYVNFYLADKPFFLGPVALGSIFGVYLIGAVITPVAGYILDRVGHRRALVGAVGMSAAGMLLTLVHNVPVIIGGLTLESSGVFACQSASSSHVGKAANEGRSSAAGLYVALYYLGGCVGSILPGFLWKQAGWLGCVGIIISMQLITAAIAYKFWQD
ncbi:MAG: MFS transporter [Syntrophobacteraceae bacterium]|jgi:MFS family permease